MLLFIRLILNKPRFDSCNIFSKLCFTATVGNTNETKENKVQTFINNEIQKTKEYQIKSWQNGKEQIARTINQIKGFFVKN